MVWALIWLDKCGRAQRSPLVIMERDSNAPRGDYSAQNYIQALAERLLPHWHRLQLSMQDSARVHTAAVTRDFLNQHHINPVNWPPYSPDLNTIERLGWHLKKNMYKRCPQYNNHSRAEEEWVGFCEALKECWRSIPGKHIKRLVLSMPQCLHVCSCASGLQSLKNIIY
jgi:transposase